MRYDLYKKYSLLLSWFANTNIGRDYLHIPKSEKIISLKSNSYTEYLGREKDKIILRTSFYSPDNHFDRYLGLGLQALEIVNKYLNNFEESKRALLDYLNLGYFSNLPKLSFEQSTFNALTNDTDILGTSDVSWATVKGLTTGTVETGVNQIRGGYVNPTWSIRRFFCRWNTAALSSQATILSADIKLYATASVDGGASIEIVKSTATDGALQNTDFDNLDLTDSFSSKALSAVALTAYNTWSLSTTGKANISKTANSLFAFTTSKDTVNQDPSPNDNNLNIQVSGDANPEQLVVTYSLPVKGGFFNILV